ncbi:MAG TPA: nucleotidyltransferase domain-containing protein [Alphaproteobacteria bacterium]|jgi:predicted nucleotidyltransferase|nr:nucleotidyltransferase domain-containing protein [Alphaproteobacteria bacterium]MDP6272304.1 nucleotidyltransferase domain-containing protein [Alphaproteobacteria bacterium]MDP7426667.1 nucleotidyltransferase domain-containing protein [Alphaproteobacteria bacterium]HJM48568.1 nucleotidyltransferase domain-containing protein [Alphaproteobacteria bacterium]|tara:strand:+ start:311 stop:664 length:354 start_codon:yes stop_codon:yes gene_type:complete
MTTETERLNAEANADLPAALLARIVERMDPLAIWLFGGRALGRARADSDYDLLAIMPDGTPEDELDPVKAWGVTRGLGVPVDLVPCTLSEFDEEKDEIDTLARAAFLHGKLIYERAS